MDQHPIIQKGESSVSHNLPALLGKTVRVRLHHTGPDAPPFAEGEVIGFYDHPSIMVLKANGTQSVHSSKLPLEVVEPLPPEPPDGAVFEELNSVGDRIALHWRDDTRGGEVDHWFSNMSWNFPGRPWPAIRHDASVMRELIRDPATRAPDLPWQSVIDGQLVSVEHSGADPGCIYPSRCARLPGGLMTRFAERTDVPVAASNRPRVGAGAAAAAALARTLPGHQSQTRSGRQRHHHGRAGVLGPHRAARRVHGRRVGQPPDRAGLRAESHARTHARRSPVTAQVARQHLRAIDAHLARCPAGERCQPDPPTAAVIDGAGELGRR